MSLSVVARRLRTGPLTSETKKTGHTETPPFRVRFRYNATTMSKPQTNSTSP